MAISLSNQTGFYPAISLSLKNSQSLDQYQLWQETIEATQLQPIILQRPSITSLLQLSVSCLFSMLSFQSCQGLNKAENIQEQPQSIISSLQYTFQPVIILEEIEVLPALPEVEGKSDFEIFRQSILSLFSQLPVPVLIREESLPESF